ncbi:MAG: Rieske (2Fe-2S) protein [Gracilibacteraceae bacterium]|jgi:cytochrome b6-f complex iron-sulfur subunit|nr:Rieske (2Fe-2S) protein [Gracilibacteraceae bacterium]
MEQPKEDLSRRTFLKYMVAFPLTAGVVAPLAIGGGALAPPLSLKPLPPIMAVALSEEMDDNPVEFIYDGAPAILFKRGAEYMAFSRKCTHLGCVISWEKGARRFKCPCHGGVFNADGEVISGPPKKPLTKLTAWVDNGMVMVQQEVG